MFNKLKQLLGKIKLKDKPKKLPIGPNRVIQGGGVGLGLPTQLKQEKKPQRPDYDACYSTAFELVISEIEGADHTFITGLHDAFCNNRDHRTQTKLLLECFKGLDWKWPVFEAYKRGEQEAGYEMEVSAIKAYEPDEIFNQFTVSRLKGIHVQCLEEKPKSSLRKKEIISKVVTVASHSLMEALRNELINALGDPSEVDKKGMAEAVVGRMSVLGHRLYRQQQALSITKFRPYWMFKSGVGDFAYEKCKQLDGTIKCYTDPFWQEHPVPCWRHDCKCDIQTLAERDLKKYQ